MYEYFSTGGKSRRIPADINRKIVEAELIHAFHWLPQDIAEIPYEKIRDLLMILEMKEEARTTRQNAERARSEAQSVAQQRGGRGGVSYREV